MRKRESCLHAKGPCILANELYPDSKEPYKYAKEPYLYTKSPYTRAIEPCMYVNGP